MEEIKPHPLVYRAAIAILSYLRDHAAAKDTASGIAKFWIGEPEEIVIDALALLIKEGVIEKRGSFYQLAKPAQAIDYSELAEKILQHMN